MSASDTSGHDPVYTAVDALVRDGTLDHNQADRVYAVVRGTPGAATPAGTAPAAGPTSAETARWSPVDRMAGGVALFGAAVAVAAALVATALSGRFDDGFDWEPFVVALGAGLALTGLTAAVHLLVADRDYSRWLNAGPAGLAVVALASTGWVALADWDHVSYLVGAVLVLGGAGAYVAVRSGATVSVAVLGGLVLLGSFLDDAAPSGADSLLWFSVPAVLYGAAVAVAGWVLPTRHVSAVLGGVIALSGVLLALVLAAFTRAVAGALAGSTGGGDTGPDYSGDAATTLALGVIVCLAMLAGYVLTGHTGYAVLGGVGPAAVLSAGLFAVGVDHTLRWAAGVGVLGVLLAAAAGLFASRRHGRPRRRPPAVAPPQQPPPSGDPAQTQVTAPKPYQQQGPAEQPAPPYQQPPPPYQQPAPPHQPPPPPQP